MQLDSKKVFVRYYWLVFTLKKSKSYSLALVLPPLSKRRLCVSETHSKHVHMLWTPPKESSGKESSPTGFNDAQIKGRDHSQDLIKRSLFVDLLIYLWNTSEIFINASLIFVWKSMLGLLWRKGGQEIEGRLWFGRKRWIAVPFPSVAGNGCGRVYQDVTRGCPKNQAARNLLSTGVPSRLDLFSRSPGDHPCSV